MRNYAEEFENRTDFIRELVKSTGAKGIIYGNSGGKDSALVGILCKSACPNTCGVILPCSSSRNYGEDADDAVAVAQQYGIETRTVDLSGPRNAVITALGGEDALNPAALTNIAPRLRMLTLYAIAANENRLVAGTGNRSEAYVGYFTKWGDGAHDFNPISDLTVTEVYEFLRFLKAPERILTKAPSAALFDGQTDEGEMGVSYAELDAYIRGETLEPDKENRIIALHKASEHKRSGIISYTK